MKFIGIIPARYQSTRFPGKPLALINNKPMVQWVYEQSSMALEEVWVATDNTEILSAVQSFGGKAVLTASDHRSGTDRCAEAARKLSEYIDFDVVVNIQGDEPFIRPEQINTLTQYFDKGVEIVTLVRRITELNELQDHNKPKVIVDANSNALYFSRATIPFIRDIENDNWLKHGVFWVHIGIYAYRSDILQQITLLQPGKLEIYESLEQLRWLENGFKIKVAETDYQSFGIDTPEDLHRSLKLFAK
jgi:3-deoxy-manno-octulosonate cytidylyltransferase (CMP-KDO synthetase)